MKTLSLFSLSTASSASLAALSFCGLLSLLLAFSSSAVADDCSNYATATVVESMVVTADSWPNLMKHKGSLSFESERMLKAVEAGIAKAVPPQRNDCPTSCKLNPQPKVVFSSIPNAFLSSYSDKQKCDALFAQTKVAPFLFSGKRFESLDLFNSWSSDFGQGKGSDGEVLYQKCDGSCSPQYYYYLAFKDQTKEVDAKVICGPARDKGDNKYHLSVSYRWQCEPIG